MVDAGTVVLISAVLVLTCSQGYKHIMENCQANATALREGLEATGRFDILSKEDGVPLVAIRLKDSSKFSVFDISENLRRFGWIVPAYTMPADAEHVAVLRVVIREDFNRSLSQRLLADINRVVQELDAHAVHAIKMTTAIATQTGEGAEDGVVTKKSVLDIEKEFAAACKDLVKNKKTGPC
jgi:glutamate decarboxylase